MTTFPGESPEYRTARDALLEREIGLRREMEAVAPARRELPPGGAVPEDYVFQGPGPDLHVPPLAPGRAARAGLRADGGAATRRGSLPVVHWALLVTHMVS